MNEVVTSNSGLGVSGDVSGGADGGADGGGDGAGIAKKYPCQKPVRRGTSTYHGLSIITTTMLIRYGLVPVPYDVPYDAPYAAGPMLALCWPYDGPMIAL